MSVDDNIYIGTITIYIVSSTGRLFHGIITLQCGLTRRILEAGMETCPTLRCQKATCQFRNYKAFCSSFRLFTFCLTGYQNAQYIIRALHYANGSH